MTSIGGIPVQMEYAPSAAVNTLVQAVINEILQLMDACLGSGEGGAIDIKSLPLSAEDHQQLQHTLGKGEVQANAELSGSTEIYETAYAGVWWITHRNMDGKIIAEQLEVGPVPDILRCHHEDIQQARVRLGEVQGMSGETGETLTKPEIPENS